MLMKFLIFAGLALLAAGYLGLRRVSLDVSLGLMGAGVLLIMLPFFLLARSASGLFGGDKKLANHITEMQLRFFCVLGLVVGMVGMQVSPGGVNPWTIGFLGLALGSGLAYGIGRAKLDPDGGTGNAIRLFISAAAVFGLIVSVITLISQLSGTSDMPTRWNVYSYLGAAGVFASIYAFYYGLAYQVNTDLVEMLRPLGFTLADGGPLAKAGRYDVCGSWEGVETLVNVTQTEREQDVPAGYYIEVSCAVRNWAGHRLLIHPKGYFNRPLGTPLLLPGAEAPAEWGAYGVYCDYPEAVPPLLAALNGPDGPVFGAGRNFAYLLLDKGRLTLGVSEPGRPSLNKVKRLMTLTADPARIIR